jgi:hypothetical protein
MNTCPYLQKEAKSAYNWSDANPFVVTKASAQAATQYSDQTNNVYNPNLDLKDSAVLPAPLLIVLFMFVIFVILMSVVYVYHWTRFSLGDRFIENASIIYFVGLILFSLPLVFFLI